MKVAVIGSEGFVGNAMVQAFQEHVDVLPIDLKLKDSVELYYTKDEVRFAFICVPTPFNPVANRYDYSCIRNVLGPLSGRRRTITCLRSTVAPDFFDDPFALSVELYHPEFLTARNAVEDFQNPDIHVVGSRGQRDEWASELRELYEKCGIKAKEWIECTRREAALHKLTHNVYRALRISFLNELYVAVEKTDSWKSFHHGLVKMFGARDFGGHYLDVPGPDGKFGFGGACFPKDLAAFIGYLEANGLPHQILDAVRNVNARMRLPT